MFSIISCSQNVNKPSEETDDDVIPSYHAGDYEFSFIHKGIERKYLIHAPSLNSHEDKLPVVFTIHGGGGTAEKAVDYFQFNPLADKEKFLVVYPQGTGKEILYELLSEVYKQ